MKKLLTILLSIFIFVPVIGTFESEEVNACGGYSVEYINDDGSFSEESCHSDFASAKSRMKELGGDVVVRHSSSYSPTKIIAMNSGIAYSYPRTSATLNIYQNVSNHSIYYKQTYVSSHYELNYVDTERYLGNGTGMIEVNVNGFHGYTDLEYVDLVPSKFIRNGIAITLGGNNSYTGEGTFTVVPSQNYYEAVRSGNYYEIVYHIFRGYPKNGTTPVSESIVIGPASNDWVEGTKYYSYDGNTFYTDADFNNFAFTYYNYYQFLPLRSKTSISADVLNAYISSVSGSVMQGTGQTFIDVQNKYGINALILFAMACHESGNGTSGYATKRYNLFGWNAVDADPSKASYFNSVADCVNEQAGVNLRGFVDITDGRFFSSSLGNKGSGLNVKYASDPYWGMEIASICYAIDKLANNKDGNLTDYDKYSLSVINTFDAEVKANASESSNTLYTTAYGPYYQEKFIVITLGIDGDYTKIQSTNPIDSSGNIKTHRTPITTGELNPISYGEYDYDLSVGYIKSSQLTTINRDNNTVIEKDDSNLSLMYLIDGIKIENNNLYINGCAFIKGKSANDINNISDTVSIMNNINDSVYKSYKANVSEYSGITFNDNHTYKYIGFDVTIPLSDIEEGSYYLNISVTNGNTTLSSNLTTMESSFNNQNANINDNEYHLSINSYYNYRLDLDVSSLPTLINYSLINKPFDSTRNSMFNFDTLTVDENLNMYMYGQAMIYYTDYDNQNNVKYTIYLVDNANNYLEIACSTLKSNFDYKTLLDSSYNLDYICFETTANLANLSKGTYSLIMKIENGSYIDFVEMNNLGGVSLPSGSNYRFFTSSIRNRLMLEIK